MSSVQVRHPRKNARSKNSARTSASAPPTTPKDTNNLHDYPPLPRSSRTTDSCSSSISKVLAQTISRNTTASQHASTVHSVHVGPCGSAISTTEMTPAVHASTPNNPGGVQTSGVTSCIASTAIPSGVPAIERGGTIIVADSAVLTSAKVQRSITRTLSASAKEFHPTSPPSNEPFSAQAVLDNNSHSDFTQSISPPFSSYSNSDESSYSDCSWNPAPLNRDQNPFILPHPWQVLDWKNSVATHIYIIADLRFMDDCARIASGNWNPAIQEILEAQRFSEDRKDWDNLIPVEVRDSAAWEALADHIREHMEFDGYPPQIIFGFLENLRAHHQCTCRFVEAMEEIQADAFRFRMAAEWTRREFAASECPDDTRRNSF
jgi:hypothetical protein